MPEDDSSAELVNSIATPADTELQRDALKDATALLYASPDVGPRPSADYSAAVPDTPRARPLSARRSRELSSSVGNSFDAPATLSQSRTEQLALEAEDDSVLPDDTEAVRADGFGTIPAPSDIKTSSTYDEVCICASGHTALDAAFMADMCCVPTGQR